MPRPVVVLVAAFCLAAGLFFCLLPALRNNEKPQAFYAFGHWFDIVWEFGIPLAVLGGAFLFVCLVAFLAGRFSKPSHWTREEVRDKLEKFVAGILCLFCHRGSIFTRELEQERGPWD